MSKKVRDFDCPVVHERVQISLRDKRNISQRSDREYFVQCNQDECQYVAENKPPCPLEVAMFADEIAEREERNLRRRQEG
jgi:hypothetical protein